MGAARDPGNPRPLDEIVEDLGSLLSLMYEGEISSLATKALRSQLERLCIKASDAIELAEEAS